MNQRNLPNALLKSGRLSMETLFAMDLASEAGSIMRKGFKLGMPRTLKADDSPVTAFDHEINRMVIDRVKSVFPGHGVLGEEESYRIQAADCWVCDPIDGTIAFSRGIPTSVFSLALVDSNGSPRVGVAYDPWLDRMFFAEKGKGTYLNGEPINVSTTVSMKGSVIGHCSYRHGTNLGVSPFRDVIQDAGAIVLDVGSIVYMHMLVACGEMDAAITPGSAHDLAAAKILVDEARGRMTDITGLEQERYDGPMRRNVASNGVLHNELIDVLRKSPDFQRISGVTA